MGASSTSGAKTVKHMLGFFLFLLASMPWSYITFHLHAPLAPSSDISPSPILFIYVPLSGLVLDDGVYASLRLSTAAIGMTLHF